MLTKERLAAIKTGDTLVMVTPDHRRNHPAEAKEVVVTKVGRKYFTVNEPEKTQYTHLEKQFTVSEGRHYHKDFGGRHELWDTIGDYNRHAEASALWNELWSYFKDKYSKPKHLTTEQLKEILETLKSE